MPALRPLSVVALAACALAVPDAASAALGPAGVRDGRNVTVFHNIDFVAAFGHPLGDPVQVDLVRDGHRVATARGPAVSTPEGGALEVNHGVTGAAGPGDCWEGATPDVHPGDLVRVTSDGGVDEVIVDELSIDSVERKPGVNGAPDDDDDEVWVRGVARSGADGTPIPTEILDSGEFRDPANGQLRMEPNEVVAGVDEGTYIAKYRAPFRFVKGAVSTALALEALMRDGHAFGYGHLPLATGALRPDAMLVEGVGLANGPALGCASSAAAPSSVGTTSVDALSATTFTPLADADVALRVGGWAAAGVGSADVEVRDESGAAVARAVTGLAAGSTAQQGFAATFTKADLAGLREGSLTVQLRLGTDPAGVSRTVLFDTTAPVVAADPAGGAYSSVQHVTLSGEGVTYKLDGGSPRAYAGIPVEIGAGRHTLVIRARDAAGNVTTQVHEYTITLPEPAGAQAAAALPAPAPPAASAGPLAAVAPVIAASGRPAPVATIVGPRRRIARARARRAGLATRFRAPVGTRTATVTVYRMTGGTLKELATKRARVLPGLRTVRLDAAALRRRLTPGVYYLEVVLRDASGRSGDPAVAFVRVRR